MPVTIFSSGNFSMNGIITVNVPITIGTSPSILNFKTALGSGGPAIPSLSGVPAGSIMVISIATANDNNDNPNITVTSSPALTWTPKAQARALHGGNADIWTTTFTTGGTITVSGTNIGSGSQTMSAVLYSIGGSDPLIGGNFATAVTQSQPSVTLNSSKANSIFICVSSDWDAINPAGHTYRDSAVEKLLDDQSGSAIYVGYHYIKQATSITSYTEGISSPSGQSSNTSVLEIRGT